MRFLFTGSFLSTVFLCQDHGELAIGDVQKVWQFLGVSDGDLHDSGWAQGDVQRRGTGGGGVARTVCFVGIARDVGKKEGGIG